MNIKGPLLIPPKEGYRGLGKNRKFYTHIPKEIWVDMEKKFTMSLGNQKRDYIDIDDLSLKIYKLTIKCSKTGIYNIGSGKSQTLKNLVNQYIKHKKYKLQITYDSILTKKYEPNLIYANINKMNKIIDE